MTNVKWMALSYTPEMATAGGSVIANHISPTECPTPPTLGPAVTFDQSGNQTGEITNLSTQSWTENTYQLGSVESVVSTPPALASSFSAIAGYSLTGSFFSTFAGANASGNSTAIQQVLTNQSQANPEQLPSLYGATCLSTQPNPLPTCGNINAIELLTTASPDFIFQKYLETFLPVRAGTNNNSKVPILKV